MIPSPSTPLLPTCLYVFIYLPGPLFTPLSLARSLSLSLYSYISIYLSIYLSVYIFNIAILAKCRESLIMKLPIVEHSFFYVVVNNLNYIYLSVIPLCFYVCHCLPLYVSLSMSLSLSLSFFVYIFVLLSLSFYRCLTLTISLFLSPSLSSSPIILSYLPYTF